MLDVMGLVDSLECWASVIGGEKLYVAHCAYSKVSLSTMSTTDKGILIFGEGGMYGVMF